MRKCPLCLPSLEIKPGFVSDAQVSEGDGIRGGILRWGQNEQACCFRVGLASIGSFRKVPPPHMLAHCPGPQIMHKSLLCFPPAFLLVRALLSFPTPSLRGRHRKGPLRGTPGHVTNPLTCVCVTCNYSLDAELPVPQLQTDERPQSLQIGDYKVWRVLPRSIWMVLKLWLLHNPLLLNLKNFISPVSKGKKL